MNEREICINVDMNEVRKLRDLLSSRNVSRGEGFLTEMKKILDLMVEADSKIIGKFYETE